VLTFCKVGQEQAYTYKQALNGAVWRHARTLQKEWAAHCTGHHLAEGLPASVPQLQLGTQSPEQQPRCAQHLPLIAWDTSALAMFSMNNGRRLIWPAIQIEERARGLSTAASPCRWSDASSMLWVL